MGNSASKEVKTCFSKPELDKVKSFFSLNFPNKNNAMNDLPSFRKELFTTLYEAYEFNLFDFLNKSSQISLKQSLKTFDINAFVLLSEILLKAPHSEEAFQSNYYKNQSYIYLIYDIIKSFPGAFRSGLLDKDIILAIFDYAINLHINLHNEDYKQAVFNRYSKAHMAKYVNKIFENLNIVNAGNLPSNSNHDSKDANKSGLETNSVNKCIDKVLFDAFISEYLISFDCLIRDYFSKLILNNNKTFIYTNNALPTFELGVSNIINTHEFFIFCMANPFISDKKHAYKLYCCNEQGFNVSSVIYSFLGFDGPVTILLSIYNKKTDAKDVVGFFLNNNFKECFENFVGDESCFVFTIEPMLKLYRVNPLSINKNKILYLSSKNHKNTHMKPGIGLGYSYSGYKLWLDMNDPFKQSYFNKFDSVFEEGSPYEEDKAYLNVKKFKFIFRLQT